MCLHLALTVKKKKTTIFIHTLSCALNPFKPMAAFMLNRVNKVENAFCGSCFVHHQSKFCFLQ